MDRDLITRAEICQRSIDAFDIIIIRIVMQKVLHSTILEDEFPNDCGPPQGLPCMQAGSLKVIAELEK